MLRKRQVIIGFCSGPRCTPQQHVFLMSLSLSFSAHSLSRPPPCLSLISGCVISTSVLSFLPSEVSWMWWSVTMSWLKCVTTEIQFKTFDYLAEQTKIYILFNHNCSSCAGLRCVRDYVITLAEHICSCLLCVHYPKTAFIQRDSECLAVNATVERLFISRVVCHRENAFFFKTYIVLIPEPNLTCVKTPQSP